MILPEPVGAAVTECGAVVEADADGQPDGETDDVIPSEPVDAVVTECDTVVEAERVTECVDDTDDESVPLVHGDADGDRLVLRVTVPERDCVSETVPDGLLLGLHDG